jgi:hypothetical protein
MAESVSYDPETRQLSNIPDFFAERLPERLQWTIEEHVGVVAGEAIGFWHWEDGSRTAIVAPLGCTGVLVDLNDRVSLELLDTLPSQMLLELA